MGWWRDFVRSKTKEIPMERATKIKHRLSLAYLFCAWNAFAIGVYIAVKERNPKTEEEEVHPSKYYSRLLRTPDAKVIRIEGFKVTERYNIAGFEKPERGRTREQREQEEREREIREREELEKKERESLNLLVEETNSL